jgi:hypothetical protein
MSSLQVQKLQSVLSGNVDVMRCTCQPDTSSCEEIGKIKCENSGLIFWHIRFDPCMCQDPCTQQENRCDCVIFAFDQTKKRQAMFVIEVKDKFNKPSLSVIKDKIQYCINRMQEILCGHMNSVEVFPILCDEKHSSLCAQASMTKNCKVRCYGKPKSIILSQYQRNIVSYYLKAADKWSC